MTAGKTLRPVKAALMLFLATSAWGGSYLAMKALGLKQAETMPHINTWFVTALSLLWRFGISTILMGFWCGREILRATRLELGQGIGLGVFGGIGLLFQMDGVQHTAASTAAFLTQCYCVFIPVTLALHWRKMPGKMLVLSCMLALAGVAVLSNINLNTFRLGRGEVESILASVLFTGQILWLERPSFQPNRCAATTMIMFAVVTVMALPIVVLTESNPGRWLAVYDSGPALWLIGALTLGGTLATYTIMNYWQPHVPATQAGLIYCCEPLFTSLFALVVPGLLSTWCAIQYPNESVTVPLIIGGGLITAANLLAIFAIPQPSALPPATDRAG